MAQKFCVLAEVQDRGTVVAHEPFEHGDGVAKRRGLIVDESLGGSGKVGEVTADNGVAGRVHQIFKRN